MDNFYFLLQLHAINIIVNTEGFVDYKEKSYWMVSQHPFMPIVAGANIKLLEPTTNLFQSRLSEEKVIYFCQMKDKWVQYTSRLHDSWIHKTLYIKQEFAILPKQVHTQLQENWGVRLGQFMKLPIFI